MSHNSLFEFPEVSKQQVKIKVFCDESGTVEPPWLYFGVLLVPESVEDALLTNLLNSRCNNPLRQKSWSDCELGCAQHNKNNTEVHFSEIRPSKKYKYDVANRWIHYFLKDVQIVYLYILGIDLSKLDTSYFGDDRVRDNIYNRFFRTALLISSKSFFSDFKTIQITRVVHDKNPSLETHTYFKWYPILTIGEQDTKVSFIDPNIIFIDSDHRNSGNPHSHFIQFVDLILSCTRCCVDYSPEINELKTALSLKASRLVKRLLKEPGNTRSSYKYVGRLKIQFFPKFDVSNLDENSLIYQLKRFDSFYTDRILSIENRGQLQLFNV